LVNKFAHVSGGADSHCLELSQHLNERGHEVAWLTTDAGGVEPSLRGEVVAATVTHTSRATARRGRAVGIAGAALWNPEAARAMTRLIVKFRPDVVHTHKLYPQLSVAPVVVASRRCVPIVQTIHDQEFRSAAALSASGGYWDQEEEKFSYQLLNSALFAVKRVVHVPRIHSWVAVSRSMSVLCRRSGIDTTVLPNFSTLRPSKSVRSFGSRRGLVFVGRLSSEKGVQDVLKLARRLEACPVTVCGDGPLAECVRAVAKELSHVHYVGALSRDAVRAQLDAARIVLMPSRCPEGGPLVALEAMACGTPVVGYDVGGLGEYVSDAGAGIVTSPNIDCLVEAAWELYEDEAQWRQLSRNGQVAATTTHAVDTYVEQLEGVYRQACV
jgi:glycosyltransferase involved in cell wall biosynthesis